MWLWGTPLFPGKFEELDHLKTAHDNGTLKVVDFSEEMLFGKKDQEELRAAIFEKFPKLLGVNGFDAQGEPIEDSSEEEEFGDMLENMTSDDLKQLKEAGVISEEEVKAFEAKREAAEELQEELDAAKKVEPKKRQRLDAAKKRAAVVAETFREVDEGGRLIAAAKAKRAKKGQEVYALDDDEMDEYEVYALGFVDVWCYAFDLSAELVARMGEMWHGNAWIFSPEFSYEDISAIEALDWRMVVIVWMYHQNAAFWATCRYFGRQD